MKMHSRIAYLFAVLNTIQVADTSWVTVPATDDTVCAGSDHIFGWTFTGTTLITEWNKGAVTVMGLFTGDVNALPVVVPPNVGKVEFAGDTQNGNASMKLANLVKADSGVYTVIVTVSEDNSQLTGTSIITVADAPTGLAVTGSGQERACSVASTGDPVVDLYWKETGAAVIAGPTTNLTIDAPGNLTGNYGCCISGPSVQCYEGASTSEYCINVDFAVPGNWTTKPELSEKVCAGADHLLHWTFDGTTTSGQWFKDGAEIAQLSGADGPVIVDAFKGKVEFSASVQGNASIKLVNPAESDAGEYAVTLTQAEDGSEFQGTSTVTVLDSTYKMCEAASTTGLSAGIIAAIAVGYIIALILVVGFVVYCCLQKPNKVMTIKE